MGRLLSVSGQIGDIGELPVLLGDDLLLVSLGDGQDLSFWSVRCLLQDSPENRGLLAGLSEGDLVTAVGANNDGAEFLFIDLDECSIGEIGDPSGPVDAEDSLDADDPPDAPPEPALDAAAENPSANADSDDALIAISAADLFAAYEDNEFAANEGFLGRSLRVDGPIGGFDDRPGLRDSSQISVSLEDEDAFLWDIVCLLSDTPDNRALLSALAVGDAITVTGVNLGEEFRTITLDECGVEAPTAAELEPPERPAGTAPIAISAADLFAAYEANVFAADRRYRDQPLRVDGPIGGFDDRPGLRDSSQISVSLEDEDAFLWDIVCLLSDTPDNRALLSALAVGDAITVTGVNLGEKFRTITLDECGILSR